MINQGISSYIDDHSSKEDEVLYELNRYTHLNVLQPRMLSGAYQGKLLEIISKIIRPEYILELGTYTGYSAICMARGLKPHGKLLTIDRNDELLLVVEKFIHKAGLHDQIECLVGDILDIVPKLDQKFDLVFMDADKREYAQYFELVINILNSGGVILVDNVLWSGKVIDDDAQDEDTLALKAFNKMVDQDDRVENIMLPIRDGITLIRKK